MARPKTSKTCKFCGASGFYWTKTQRGWKLQDPMTGTIHVCSGQLQAGTAQQPSAEELAEDHPEAPPAAEPTEAGRSIYGLVRPYILNDPEIGKGSGLHLVQHEVTVNGPDTARTITGAHKQLPTLIRELSMGDPVMLVGPAGSGKTQASEQAAEALGAKFYPLSIGPQTSKSDLLGYLVPGTGELVRTGLRNAYEAGGVALLDEIDAGHAGVLTVINALSSNGCSGWPDGVQRKHENFRLIAAANTYGNGADREYVGRQQLDAATLDRFVVIYWDYDTDLEGREAAAYGQSDWAEYVWQLRKARQATGVRAIFGTRKVLQGAKRLAAGFSRAEVEERVLWKGIAADDRQKLQNQVR